MTHPGSPDPRTITFNQRPEDEAQFRSARLGTRIMTMMVMWPALVCLSVAALYNLWWALSIGANLGERLALGLVSLALTCCVGGLPVASVLLATAYPRGARQAMSLWCGAIYLSAFSAFYFVATRDFAQDGWQSTEPSIAWLSGGVLDERQTRALIYLLLSLTALTFGGLLLRLGVLASAESWRLGTGQARWSPEQAPVAALEAPQVLQGVTSQTPEEIFGLWANRRLRAMDGAHVQGSVAYKDYEATCQMTGVAALSITKFGTLMTARAASTEGRVIKSKVNGNVVYQGWTLVGSADDVAESGEASVPVDTPRGDPRVIPLRPR
jgi:hypothetical protein